MTVSAPDLLARLQALSNPDNVAGMARYGINPAGTLGVSVVTLRGIAKELRPWRRRDPMAVHDLAQELWASGVHEARILAVLIDIAELVTESQADAWVADLDSWDVCDQTCALLASTGFAYAKAREWTSQDPTFVKRAGLVMMCRLAVHDKAAADADLIGFLPIIEGQASDDRNFVKKAVNWALRQIGKRSIPCHEAAIKTAERILAKQSQSVAARWVARDALRELRSEAVLRRLGVV